VQPYRLIVMVEFLAAVKFEHATESLVVAVMEPLANWPE
jgi:hypothetical protein